MTDLTVIMLDNKHVPRIGRDNQFHNTRVVSIKVGDFGPFTAEFAEGQDTPDHINAWKQEMVRQVQATL
jgi:hypothetical protein